MMKISINTICKMILILSMTTLPFIQSYAGDGGLHFVEKTLAKTAELKAKDSKNKDETLQAQAREVQKQK